MAVASTFLFSTGLYVPFRGVDRTVSMVGTYFIDLNDAGEAGGGGVVITLTMGRDEFGFHPIFIPTRISTFDDLAAAEEVRVALIATGNERISAALTERRLPIATANGQSAEFESLQVPIEPDQLVPAAVLTASWDTNTDTKDYSCKVFGVLYDAEAMASGKAAGRAVDVLLGGVR